MIGTLDSQVIDKYKEFQNKSGEYLDLDIERVEFKKISLSDNTFFEINPKKSEIDISLKNSNIDVSFVPLEKIDAQKGIMDSSVTRKIIEVYNGYTYFKENDVIFTKVTPSMENGNFAIAKNLTNGIGFGSSEYHVFRCKNFIPELLWLLFRADFFRKRAQKIMRGAGGLKRVPVDFFDTQYIPIPQDYSEKYKSIDIQRALVAFLEFWKINYTDVFRKTMNQQQPIFKKIKNTLVPATFRHDDTLVKSFNEFAKRSGYEIKLDEITFEKIDFFDIKKADLLSPKKLEKNQDLILQNAETNGFPVYSGASEYLCKVSELNYPGKIFIPNKENPDISFANNGDGSAGRNFFIHYDKYFINQERTVISFSNDIKFYSLFILNQINNMRAKYNMNRENRPTPKDLPKFGIQIVVPFHKKVNSFETQKILVEFWNCIFDDISKKFNNFEKISDLTAKIDEVLLHKTFNEIYWRK
ncbi:hypothetical protein [Sulfurimonas sp.]|uniref:restriction endonuclease subunit S n=1 Tax=Sulfurimonas sp. TaxID=2022749 RepID=UPI0025D8CD7D|nr:hypothetical protein [Sulfurimonas sp.]MCK9454006.1 hypothetical protein [Sulfurimonas sp.]